jgi:hypothetical protein
MTFHWPFTGIHALPQLQRYGGQRFKSVRIKLPLRTIIWFRIIVLIMDKITLGSINTDASIPRLTIDHSLDSILTAG